MHGACTVLARQLWLNPDATFPILLSHWKLSGGDGEVSGTCPVFATRAYGRDTAASQFLRGDSQPLLQYWLNFMGAGRVLEQIQGARPKRSRDGWIWRSGPSSHDTSSSREKGQGERRHWLLPMAINEGHFVQVTSVALLNVTIQECRYCAGSCQLAKATAGVYLFICLYM